MAGDHPPDSAHANASQPSACRTQDRDTLLPCCCCFAVSPGGSDRCGRSPRRRDKVAGAVSADRPLEGLVHGWASGFERRRTCASERPQPRTTMHRRETPSVSSSQMCSFGRGGALSHSARWLLRDGGAKSLAGSTSASLARLKRPVLSAVIGKHGRCLCAAHWRRQLASSMSCALRSLGRRQQPWATGIWSARSPPPRQRTFSCDAWLRTSRLNEGRQG
jgi:hypothetical protein